MISLKNVTKKKGTRIILDDISFHLDKGECAALVGPNGAGKTTLLKVAATLIRPDSGELIIGNLDPANSSHQLKIRELIGYLDHEGMLYGELSVEENLTFSGQMYFLKENYTKEKIDYLLDKLKIIHRKHDMVKRLSRGMKQKASIARTLLHEPEILLLDEPLTGLDKNSVKVFKSILENEKRKGKTILLASHKPEQLQELFDKVIHIKNGRVVEIEAV